MDDLVRRLKVVIEMMGRWWAVPGVLSDGAGKERAWTARALSTFVALAGTGAGRGWPSGWDR